LEVIRMLWTAVLASWTPTLTLNLSAWALPAVAAVVAAVPVALAAYKTLTRERAYRPALRVVEGGRRELTLNPA
jgi:hypothetical protein